MKIEKWGNQEIGNNERLFEEKRKKNLKCKKENMFYMIHGRDYKRKSDPNPHTNPVFYADLDGI